MDVELNSEWLWENDPVLWDDHVSYNRGMDDDDDGGGCTKDLYKLVECGYLPLIYSKWYESIYFAVCHC